MTLSEPDDDNRVILTGKSRESIQTLDFQPVSRRMDGRIALRLTNASVAG
jgi:hypothetical protein